MVLASGQRLSHYRLVDKIGEGGMGVVWRAVDLHLDREVALKVLPDGFASDPTRLERFEREAKLLASLNHPRIASLFGLHVAAPEVAGQSELRFLSMELIDGEDLARHLARGAVPPEEALRIALQIAEGLEAAHERGIVHRDLKPANIKLTPRGEVKILDFGLAKALQDPAPADPADLSRSPTMTAAATQAGVILGTAAYMSPEQARGHEADRRTDVWAFGCVLYELLTGRGIFHGPTASDCIAGILGREPDWNALPAETPGAVRRVLRRCLDKDARRRLHDIADARIEIEDALGDTPDDDARPPEAARGFGGRIAWGALGLLLGAAAVALFARGAGPVGATAAEQPKHLMIALPVEVPVIPEPQNRAVALSPDGRTLVYVGLSDNPDKPPVSDIEDAAFTRSTQLFSRRVDEFRVTAIEGTSGAAAPFFSPDGEWIGFTDMIDGQLKKTRLRGGVPVALEQSVDARGPIWGEDGRIYFGLGVGGLMSISEDGGDARTLTVVDRERKEKTHRFPSVLPRGRGLLFTLGSASIGSYDEAAIALLDPRTGEVRVLFEGGSAPIYLDTGHIVYGRDGTLEAVPFDLDALKVTGPPFTVVDGVVTAGGYGTAHYSVSGDGTLAFVPGGPERYRRNLYFLDRKGELERLKIPDRRYGSATFTRDGRNLILTTLGGNASIWKYDIERQTLTRLTSEWDNWGPVVSRDGRYLAFGSNRDGKNGLWRLAVDGSSPPELLLHEERFGLPGNWSVGDRYLSLFFTSPGTGYDIWLLSRGETWTAEPLLQTAFQEEEPMFSPDGQWLAYTSDDTGQSELYLRHFPVDGRKWQLSVGGASSVVWSPDGKELYYWKGNHLMGVSVTTTPEVRPGRERQLPHPAFTHLRSWDISPDGERFVIVGRTAPDEESETPVLTGSRRRPFTDADVRQIRIITDWFTEIRQGAR